MQEKMPGGRIELPTQGFSVLRSTTELSWQKNSKMEKVGGGGFEPAASSV